MKITTKKGFYGMLYCTWPASSEGEDCVLFIFVSAESVTVPTMVLEVNERVNGKTTFHFTSIQRWSRLLVCEIERELPVYQPGWSYLILIISSISNPPVCWKSRMARTGLWKCRLGVRNAWKKFEKGINKIILV